VDPSWAHFGLICDVFLIFVGVVGLLVCWFVGLLDCNKGAQAAQQHSNSTTQPSLSTRPGGMREAIKSAAPLRGVLDVCHNSHKLLHNLPA